MKVFMSVMGKDRARRTEFRSSNLTNVIFVMDDGQEFTVKEGASGLCVSVDSRLVVEPVASNAIQLSELLE